jgi:hypothetical protein
VRSLLLLQSVPGGCWSGRCSSDRAILSGLPRQLIWAGRDDGPPTPALGLSRLHDDRATIVRRVEAPIEQNRSSGAGGVPRPPELAGPPASRASSSGHQLGCQPVEAPIRGFCPFTGHRVRATMTMASARDTFAGAVRARVWAVAQRHRRMCGGAGTQGDGDDR